MTDLNEYSMTTKEKRIFYGAMMLSGLFLSLLFYRNIFFAPLIFVFTKKIKRFYIDKMKEKRKENYLVQFKDFLFMLSTSIGTGRSMKDAIGETLPNLKNIYGENAILHIEMNKAYERMETGGENDVYVLNDLAIASGLEDCIDFVSIYSICKTTGASLICALNKAASVIIDKMTIEREVKELVKRKETEGLIIFFMPIIVILFLNLCAQDYINPLYESLIGRIIMTLVIVLNIVIYGIIQKIVNVRI